MATVHSTDPAAESPQPSTKGRRRVARKVKDPIAPMQARVHQAKALCSVLADIAEPVSTYELDLVGALLGIADLLNGIFLDLDPDTFRAAVLGSAKVHS